VPSLATLSTWGVTSVRGSERSPIYITGLVPTTKSAPVVSAVFQLYYGPCKHYTKESSFIRWSRPQNRIPKRRHFYQRINYICKSCSAFKTYILNENKPLYFKKHNIKHQSTPVSYNLIFPYIPFVLKVGGDEWSISRPSRFTPRKEPGYPLNTRLGGPQSRSVTLDKRKTLLNVGT
jgi:hypothetical protein